MGGLQQPVMRPFDDNDNLEDIPLMRPVEVLLDSLQSRDYALLRLQVASGVRVCLVAPRSRYGDPFDATPTTVAHRMDRQGPEAWANRTWLPNSVSLGESTVEMGGASAEVGH